MLKNLRRVVALTDLSNPAVVFYYLHIAKTDVESHQIP